MATVLRHEDRRVLDVDAPTEMMPAVLLHSQRLGVTSYPAEAEGARRESI